MKPWLKLAPGHLIQGSNVYYLRVKTANKPSFETMSFHLNLAAM